MPTQGAGRHVLSLLRQVLIALGIGIGDAKPLRNIRKACGIFVEPVPVSLGLSVTTRFEIDTLAHKNGPLIWFRVLARPVSRLRWGLGYGGALRPVRNSSRLGCGVCTRWRGG